MERPNYYGILPADVRYDKNLKPMEKIMYTEITSLSNRNGYCNASNSYFAELYDVHKNTVGTWINNLEKQGYIKTELIYKQGTKEIISRKIYIDLSMKTLTPINEKIDTYQRKDLDPINENIEDNNTSNNITSNNNKKIYKKSSKKNSTDKIKEFIKSLDKANDYKELLFKFVEHRTNINKRLKTVEPIKKLIRNFNNFFSLEEAINLAIEKEWQSIEPEWIVNYKNSKMNKMNKPKANNSSDLLVDDDFIEQMKERYK